MNSVASKVPIRSLIGHSVGPGSLRDNIAFAASAGGAVAEVGAVSAVETADMAVSAASGGTADVTVMAIAGGAFAVVGAADAAEVGGGTSTAGFA